MWAWSCTETLSLRAASMMPTATGLTVQEHVCIEV